MTYCNNGVGLAQDAGMFQSLGLGDTSYEAPILTNDIFSKTANHITCISSSCTVELDLHSKWLWLKDYRNYFMTQAKKYYNSAEPSTDDFAASLNIYQLTIKKYMKKRD